MRQTFPTLDETPRGQWPATLRTLPAAAGIEGASELVVCWCSRPVPGREIYDFRALTTAQRTTLQLPALCCTACYRLLVTQGKTLEGDVARAFGLDPVVTAALDAGDTRAVARGVQRLTAITQKLTANPFKVPL